MSRSETLYQLQQFDSELDKSSKRIKEINKLLEDREKLISAIAIQENLGAILAKKQAELKIAENDVADQSFKLDQSQKKLYSGVVTNPKELEDLQLESEALLKFLAVLEERQLESMVDTEQSQEEYNQASARAEEISFSLDARDDQLNNEKSDLNALIQNSELSKISYLDSHDIPDLQTYQSLRKALNGIAVALMLSNSCSSCGSNIPSAISQEVRSRRNIINCPTCNRILHPG
jgi:predicted  nucleic acid-binding Zn-ribbon protein